MAYATAEDVAVRWGRDLTVEETALVNVRLEDVERMIRRRIPDLDDQVASGQTDVEDVVQVESDVVLRLARNPEGYQSETDGNYAYTIQKDLATGRLQITDDEWAILGAPQQNWFILTPRPVVDTGAYGFMRRDVEYAWKHNKVIDWVRQIW
jgi:hypothetical protein